MSILGRLTLRNIFGKPMRSAAITVALAASAFALLLVVGGRNAPEKAYREMIMKRFGGCEMTIIDTNRNITVNEADFPEGTKLLPLISSKVSVQGADKTYSVTLRSFDTAQSEEMGLTGSGIDLSKGAYLSEAFAKKAKLSAGDSFTVKGTTENGTTELTLKVAEVSKDKYLTDNPNYILVDAETVKKAGGLTGTGVGGVLVDIPDDLNVEKVWLDTQKKYPDYAANALLTDEVIENQSEGTVVFYMIFAVIMLLTLFLAFSMSRHIANERLSAVGTLRSLGGSIPRTSLLLIGESSVYGLAGGMIGLVAFLFLGKLAVGTLSPVASNEPLDIPVFVYPIAVVFAVAIQLICQSGALIRAVRTPVRDIIFSSRDTAYHLSRTKIIIGAVLICTGSVIGFLSDELVPGIAAVTLYCVGTVMVLPLILRGLSKVFSALLDKLGMPCAKLAANEGSHKKSSVAGTQLTFSALSIVTLIFIIALSVIQLYDDDIYKYDGRISAELSEEKYSFITEMPEIDKYEFRYSCYSTCTVNGSKKRFIDFIAASGYELYTAITGVGEEPADGELYMSDVLANSLGIKVGDEIEIEDTEIYIYNENDERQPCIYKFKVKGLCSTAKHYTDTVIVGRHWYTENFGDHCRLQFTLKDPSGMEAVQAKLETKYPDEYVVTREDDIQSSDENMSSIMSIIYAICAVGSVLALLGAASNAVIGFEQSRRKYAVLHSVAASKRKLAKLILIETLFSAVTAGALALLSGFFLSAMLNSTLSAMNIGLTVLYDVPMTAAFIAAVTAVLLAAAIKPIVSLKKMNTAAELKYE